MWGFGWDGFCLQDVWVKGGSACGGLFCGSLGYARDDKLVVWNIVSIFLGFDPALTLWVLNEREGGIWAETFCWLSLRLRFGLLLMVGVCGGQCFCWDLSYRFTLYAV